MQRDTRGGIAYNHSPVVVTPLTSTMTMFFRLRSAVSSFIARGFDVAPPISFVLRLDVTRCSSFAVPLFFQCYEGQRVPARVYSRPAIYPSSLFFPPPLLPSLLPPSPDLSYHDIGGILYARHIPRFPAVISLDTTPTRPVSRIHRQVENSRAKSRTRTFFPWGRRLPKIRDGRRGRIIGSVMVAGLERR